MVWQTSHAVFKHILRFFPGFLLLPFFIGSNKLGPDLGLALRLGDSQDKISAVIYHQRPGWVRPRCAWALGFSN